MGKNHEWPLIVLLVILLGLSVFSFVVACPTFYEGNYNFETLSSWLLPSLGSFILALTAFFIYKQIKQEKEFQKSMLLPKIAVRKAKKEDQHEDHRVRIKEYEIENLTFRVSFTNDSINMGEINAGVFAFVYNFNDNKSSNNISYIEYALKGMRQQKPLDMETNIKVHPKNKIMHDYTFPHHFKLINTDDAIDSEALLGKLVDNNLNYNDGEDFAYYYLIFLARVRINCKSTWAYTTEQYYYFKFEGNEFKEIYHLPDSITESIVRIKNEKGWKNI